MQHANTFTNGLKDGWFTNLQWLHLHQELRCCCAKKLHSSLLADGRINGDAQEM